MDILFRTEKLRKVCNDDRLLKKEYGDRGRRIRQRLDELRAARTLEDMRFLPAARCHELKGDRRDQLAVDLIHPHRLLFTPVDARKREDGGLDWSSVTAVVIEEVIDYH